MKRKLLICFTALLALLITSCGNSLTVKDDTPQDMAKIVINAGVNNSSRHFFPTGDEVDVSKFQDFSLKLQNTSTSITTSVFSYVSYSDISKPYSIDVGTYNITLTAYKILNGKSVLFTDTLENVQLVADKTNKLSFTLEPANTNQTGTISFSVTFDNSKGDVDVVVPVLCVIDEVTGDMEPVKEPEEDDCFFKGTSFNNTSKETVSGTITDIEPGSYLLVISFNSECSDDYVTLDYYSFYNINVYGGFDTAVSQTVKLNPVYTISYEEDDDGVITELNAETLGLPAKYTRMTDFDLGIPEKEGFYFLGWFDGDDRVGTSDDNGYYPTFVSGNRGNKTLVAKYQEIAIAVKFLYEQEDDGEYEEMPTQVSTLLTTDKNFKQQLSYTIGREGYALSPDNSWYEEGITVDEIISIIKSQEDESDFEIYFDKVYTILYPNLENQGITYTGEMIYDYTRHTPTFDLPVLSKPDYDFVGWYKESDFEDGNYSVPKDGAVRVESVQTGTRENIRLVAVWTNKINSGFEITLPEQDDFDLSDNFQLNCTENTDTHMLTLALAPKEGIDASDILSLTSHFTYQWSIDGTVIEDADSGSKTLDLTAYPSLTPNSIHYVTVAVTYNSRVYTLTKKFQMVDAE